MNRVLIIAIVCAAQIGCQTPYSPFGPQSTRVPPPPTGSIGNGNYDSTGYGQGTYPPSGYPNNPYPQSAYPPSNSYSPRLDAAPSGRRYAPGPSSSPIAPLPPSLGAYSVPAEQSHGATELGPWGDRETPQSNTRMNVASRTTTESQGHQESLMNTNSLTHNERLQWTDPSDGDVPPSLSSDFAVPSTIVRGNNLPDSASGSTTQPSHYIPVP